VRECCAALLGQRDSPTDGVEDYCRYLSEALRPGHFVVEIVRLRWEEIGCAASVRELREKARSSAISWFLLQYTALAWSRRGFPTRIVSIVKSLKKNARCAVTFHDAEPYGGTRWIDLFRRIVQVAVMRKLLRLCDLAIFTVPREKVSWVPANAQNVVFIPVGANLPDPEKAWTRSQNSADRRPVIAVFSITGDARGLQEISVISQAVNYAARKIGPLRVILFGRNSELGGEELKAKLSGSPVEVLVMGLIPADEIVQVLGLSDVLLFVRGPISSRRGSAIAGIACGLPVIAEEGSETAAPITEAGVVLVPAKEPREFGPALVRVLADRDYRALLAERSRNAQERYFSWNAIATQYTKALRESASSARSQR
jgi:glycosyltransferase involved in cell wall biosynthesis